MKDKKKKHRLAFPYFPVMSLAAFLLLSLFAVNTIAAHADTMARYSTMMLTGYRNRSVREAEKEPDASSSETGEPSRSLQSAESSGGEESEAAEAPREVTNQPESSETPKAAKGGAKLAKVLERTYGKAGLNYGNIWVKNLNKNHTLHIKTELRKKPDITIQKDQSPQVLIVHTHTSESFAEQFTGFYESSFQPRSQTGDRNIVSVGAIIADTLKKNGIGVIHDKTCHDYPEYTGSYSRAARTIKKNLKKYPTIQVVLDIHRDAIIQSGGTRVKPTAVIAGKKAAQVMIISGCDDEGKLGFKDWELNLRFALRLQKSMADTYPALARPINFAPRQYNMNLTHGSLLVEFGTDVNTLEEAHYSARLFSECLVKTLENLK